MFELGKLVAWVASPLLLTFVGWGMAVYSSFRGRKWLAVWIGSLATVFLWLSATLYTAQLLAAKLERSQPAVAVALTPSGDAIVVLEGALGSVRPETLTC